MEDAQKTKAAVLESMNKLVKGLLDKNKDSVGVQVDDGELLWLPEHFLGVRYSDDVAAACSGICGVPTNENKRGTRRDLRVAREERERQRVRGQSRGEEADGRFGP